MKIKRAFTLVETMLSIALIVMITGSFFFAYEHYQFYNDMDMVATSIAQSLRRAQLYSQAIKEDDSWGVKVLANKLVVFKGDDYASRDEAYDESLDFPSAFEVGDYSEIIYEKFSGQPESTGTISITGVTGLNREIEINSKGKIEY